MVEVSEQPERRVVVEGYFGVGFQTRQQFRRELLDYVNFAGLQGSHAGSLVGNLDIDHPVDVGGMSAGSAACRARMRAVILIAHRAPAVAGQPFLEDEGARAVGRTLRGFVGGVVVVPVGGYQTRSEALWADGVYDKPGAFFQVQAEVQVVFDGEELVELAGTRAELVADQPEYGRSVLLAVQRSLNLLGGERRAVVELDALAYLECPRKVVVAALPAFYQQGTDAVVAGVLEQPFENGVGHIPGAGRRRPERVEGLDAARCHDTESSAELRFVGGHRCGWLSRLLLRHGRELRRLRRGQSLHHSRRRGGCRSGHCGRCGHCRRLGGLHGSGSGNRRGLLRRGLLHGRGAGTCHHSKRRYGREWQQP